MHCHLGHLVYSYKISEGHNAHEMLDEKWKN